MSKVEILEELPRLTREERKEVLLRLAEIDGNLWLDADDPLTDAEKALLDARLALPGRKSKLAFAPGSPNEPPTDSPARS